MTATLTINKATYDMKDVVFEDKTVTYDGTEQSIVASNLPNGVSISYHMLLYLLLMLLSYLQFHYSYLHLL